MSVTINAPRTNQNMNYSYILFFVFAFGLASCKNEEPKFVNIQKANEAFIETCGIDLLKFKDKIEASFTIHDGFYDSLLVQTINENHNIVFDKYGYFSITTAGKTITAKDHDTLIYNLGISFANNMILEDCLKNKVDSFCIVKNDYYHNLSRIKIPVSRIPNKMPDFIYYNLHKKGYLTQEEFKFMTLWWYVLSSIQQISDEEWRLEKLNR